jgi:hypothetical protein
MTADDSAQSIAGYTKSLVLSHIQITTRHHDEKYLPTIPSAEPTYSPAIDAIAQGSRLEEPQELGLKFHSDPSMAL